MPGDAISPTIREVVCYAPSVRRTLNNRLILIHANSNACVSSSLYNWFLYTCWVYKYKAKWHQSSLQLPLLAKLMFTSFVRVSAILFAVSLASAANLPAARTTTYLVCAICPSVDTAGHAVSPLNGYGLTPPERFCGYVSNRDNAVAGLTVVLVSATSGWMDSSPTVSTMYVLSYSWNNKYSTTLIE